MFDKKLLESSEFYERRYRNFATLIIMPIFVLFIAVVVFSFFGKRELTVKTTGQIVPRKVLSVVQSSSNNPIEINNLAEGKKVKKGDVLLTYKDDDGSVSVALLSSQLQTAKDRLHSLDTYKRSIVSGSNQFDQADSFGYSDMFDNYLAQVKTLSAEYDQAKSDKATSDRQVDAQKNALADAANQASNKIVQYQAVISAIRSDKNEGLSNNPYAYMFDSYVAGVKGLAGDDKEKVRQEAITTINQAIDQLNDSIANYQIQSKSIGSSGTISPETTQDKAASLKSEQLASVAKEYTDQKVTVDKLNAQIRSEQSMVGDDTLRSEESGILHVPTGKMKPKYYSKGTDIAEIYPDFAGKPSLDIEFLVPAAKISGISVGEKVRFRVVKSVSKPLVINGKIASVDTTASDTKQGNYFKVIANIHLNSAEYQQIKYGSEGITTVITGQKSWFNYIKDLMLND